MSKKPKKARRGKGSRSKAKNKRKKGLGDTQSAKAKSLKQSLKESGAGIGGTLLGIGLAAGTGYALDQIEALKPKETDKKFMVGLKKAVKPITVTALGAGVSIYGHKNNKKFIANTGDGMAAGGVFIGIKAIAGDKIKLFSGLGNVSEENLSNMANYYRENVDELRKVLTENGKLIELSGYENAEDLGRKEIILPGYQLNMTGSKIL